MIKDFNEWKKSQVGRGQLKEAKKGRRQSFLMMAGSLLGKSPRKTSAPDNTLGAAASEDSQSTDSLKMDGEEGLLKNIAKNLRNKAKQSYFNVIMNIHLLGGQQEAVTVMVRTTAAEISMAMASTLGIDASIADECLGLFEYSQGMFKLLDDDEQVLRRVVQWSDRQDHVNDMTVRFVYKRKSYRRHDALELAERSAEHRRSGPHRLLVGSVSYHTTRGLYTIKKGQIFAFAAAALYSKSGGNASGAALKNIKAGLKKHKASILPPHMHNMSKSEFKQAAKAISEEYAKMVGLDMMEVERVVCRNVRSWTDVYGASFFPVKCKSACDISNAEFHFQVAILAVAYDQITATIYNSDGDIEKTIAIPFHMVESWEKHELSMQEDETLTLVALSAPKHETAGLFVESIMWEDIVKVLNMYKKMFQKFKKDGTMAGSEGNRRQVSRRESVKVSASAILDDMGDAFDDMLAESNDVDSGDDVGYEDEEYEEAKEENADEIWDPHTTDTGQTYYVGRKSRRSSWIIPTNVPTKSSLQESETDKEKKNSAESVSIESAAAEQAQLGWTKTQDEEGRIFYFEKGAGRRTSWVLPPGEIVIESNVNETPLADGWVETADQSGNTYYAHADGTTSWERPE